MKKNTVFLIILLAVINNASAQIMDFDIVGVYLPVEYIETLKRTKHNPASWAAFYGENTYHTVYIVDTYTIKTSGRYDGEGYVYLWELFNFQFENIDGDIYLTDNNNNRFKKIPGYLYEFEDWNEIIGNYIGGILLGELINTGDIILENNLVTFPMLGNKTFRIQWQAYDPKQRMNLEFEGVTGNQFLLLEIRSNEYIFYGGNNYFSPDMVWSKKL